MTHNISKKDLEKKSKEIKTLIKGIVNETINIPNDALIFSDPSALTEIFTKKRLELIELIDKFRPKSAQELVSITKRKKQAINRDLKILERHEIIEFKRNGKNTIPLIKKVFILFPLTNHTTLKEFQTVKVLEDNKLYVENKIEQTEVG